MSERLDICGFVVSLEGDEAVCRFAGPSELGSGVPPTLEEAFRTELQPGGRLAGKSLVVSLSDTPALSSRQLGALLAVHRAAGGEAKLVIRGVRPNVRDLFEMTRMAEFFDY